jgi:hypothetical protein
MTTEKCIDMKNKFLYCLIPCLAWFITSCNKNDVVANENEVGISRITYYATVTLNGSQYMSVVYGSIYTDPGATATEKGNPIAVTKSGTVNTSQVGIYPIVYTAVNADGFPATATRYVAVLPSPELPGVDISGSYYYVPTGGNNSTVTKVAPGFYTTTNLWSSATVIPAMFITVNGTTIIIPNQTTGFGPMSGTGTLTAGALNYVVSLPAQGISNSIRRWHI